ncbi:hypothetical protein AKJ09_04135 [Labilithrix luteola]|uniref:Ketopantoate reductase N-terminal domain-containing protein n=1 Tax=Labilithrix luteola TaxID=1391654 RepID=A0A0K1PVR2_9BACT|nr:hypothetical protein AKJ09_04135 [Labilithrix luteola]
MYGAGALGSVYGVRLATRTNTTVSFVVRKRRVAERTSIVIERVRGNLREEIASPHRTDVIAGDVDLILLTVATDKLEETRSVLEQSDAPIVVLTPMMPQDYARMREAFGDRVLAGMPTVVAYARENVIRYWQPPEPTRIDEPRAGDRAAVVRALVRSLEEAGIPTHLEMAVHEINPATTVCFIPIGMLVAIAGSLERLARDPVLVDLAARACREGAELAPRLGHPMGLATFAPLLAHTLPLRATAAVLGRLSPEALTYVDVHFGRKLLTQHAAMARTMSDLARLKSTPHVALDELRDRLAAVNVDD